MSRHLHTRAGWTNIQTADNYTTVFPVNFPAVGTVVGINTFVLTAEDVTPAPYNQPPYPAAGDTDTAQCTVVGVAP